MSITIDVAQLEFHEGSNTIWVHNNQGMTVLRIKCSGKIEVDKVCTNLSAHADLNVVGDIHFCIPKGASK